MDPKQVALLIDFENLIIGLDNNNSDFRKVFSAKNVIDTLEKNIGRVVFRKAFADWSNTKTRKYAQDITRCGIEMQHVIRNGFNNKNFSDSFMVIQAMDCLIRFPQIGTYVLATGDSDFLPLISYLKSTGRTVIGLAAEGTVSGAILANCDDFIFYSPDGLHIGKPSMPDKGPVIKALKSIIGTGGAYVADLEEAICNAVPDFNTEDYGCHDMLTFLDTLPNLVHVDNTGSEPKAFWLSAQPGIKSLSRYSGRSDTITEQLSMPLNEYMKATRWYIADGPTRETVLTNIFDILDDDNTILISDELRRKAAPDTQAVDDRAWQGTVFSLVCGACLWEKPESSSVPLHCRKLSLFNTIDTLEDFMLGYYSSLFHKAIQERKDIDARAMAELMHPEDVEGHLAIFEKVYAQLT